MADRALVSIDLRFMGQSGMGIATYQRALWQGLRQLAPDGMEWVAHCDAPLPEDRGWAREPGPRGSRNLWNLFVLPRRLRALRPALHHATVNFEAPLGAGCPLVVTLHDLIPMEHPELVSRRHRLLSRALVPVVLRAATRVIVDSADVRDRVARRYPAVADRLRVVHCGLPQELIDAPDAPDAPADELERLRRRLPALPGRFLLFVGPADPRKNPSVLLRALLDIEASGREVPKLVMVGRSGPRSHELEALRTATSRHVIDLGHVSEEDLGALRRSARGVLFPSRAEGFGYPPLEALAAGAPTVASALPVLQEILGSHVDYCPVDDAAAWGRAMLALEALDGSMLRARQQAGAAHARGFTPLRSARQTRDVYLEVIEG